MFLQFFMRQFKNVQETRVLIILETMFCCSSNNKVAIRKHQNYLARETNEKEEELRIQSEKDALFVAELNSLPHWKPVKSVPGATLSWFHPLDSRVIIAKGVAEVNAPASDVVAFLFPQVSLVKHLLFLLILEESCFLNFIHIVFTLLILSDKRRAWTYGSSGLSRVLERFFYFIFWVKFFVLPGLKRVIRFWFSTSRRQSCLVMDSCELWLDWNPRPRIHCVSKASTEDSLSTEFLFVLTQLGFFFKKKTKYNQNNFFYFSLFSLFSLSFFSHFSISQFNAPSHHNWWHTLPPHEQPPSLGQTSASKWFGPSGSVRHVCLCHPSCHRNKLWIDLHWHVRHERVASGLAHEQGERLRVCFLGFLIPCEFMSLSILVAGCDDEWKNGSLCSGVSFQPFSPHFLTIELTCQIVGFRYFEERAQSQRPWWWLSSIPCWF